MNYTPTTRPYRLTTTEHAMTERNIATTKPQRELLERVERDGTVIVSGNTLRVAVALDRKRLIDLVVAGSGVAYSGAWWYEARRKA